MESSEISGILNILKPPGMTSHDVVSYIRRSLKIKKVGHTGTLDPGVAGVLPVCLGKATKIIEYMADDIKQYRAEVTFGRSTDTQDGFGQVTGTRDASWLSEDEVRSAIGALVGIQSQIPPMVSALKHQGRKLYELAREGLEVPREPRKFQVFETEVVRCTGFGTPEPVALFDIKCSKGTYVRTVCHDLGEMLGCGGFMSFLVRTATGRFNIADALTIEEISDLILDGKIYETILPADAAVSFASVLVNDRAVQFVAHGNRVDCSVVENIPEMLAQNQLVKLVHGKRGCLAVARVLSTQEAMVPEGQAAGYVFQPLKVLC